MDKPLVRQDSTSEVAAEVIAARWFKRAIIVWIIFVLLPFVPWGPALFIVFTFPLLVLYLVLFFIFCFRSFRRTEKYLTLTKVVRNKFLFSVSTPVAIFLIGATLWINWTVLNPLTAY